MKKLIIACVIVSASGSAYSQQSDSLRLEQLQEVVVKGVRAQQDAPYAVSNIDKSKLQHFATSGKELPFLFSQTPGVLVWSENGMGTGTTYMRIRGAADSRINVTIDGVPLNSPEDQCVFWANMNSYASLLGSVQIQRGVGSSTNGDGAFGGNISLSSKVASPTPYAELSGSYGSYNTFNVGGYFSTGMLWDHFVIDGAYHETNTDGYIHGTGGRSGSYLGSLQYLNDNLTIRYKNFGNFEKTGQAWNGVTAGDNDLSLMDGTFGARTGIKTYGDLCKVGLGKYNTLYETLSYGDDGNFAQNANGRYITQRYTMADGSFWRKATDNFWQNHNILSMSWNINHHFSTAASLHYTHGYGYYNEFRPNNKLSKFGLPNYTSADGKTVKRADFIRQKGMKQDAYGLVWNGTYKNEVLEVTTGASLQRFSANHFGYLTYAEAGVAGFTQHILGNGKYQYYDSDAEKDDYSGYIKATYKITPQLQIFADAQYRHVDYTTDGINDRFYDNGDGTFTNQRLDIDKKYDFANLKGGLSYTIGQHQLYASVATSNREPERNNFTDNGSYPAPKAEKVTDFEAGYRLRTDKLQFGINGYFMDYTDQFVQTGAVSDIGEKLTTNIKDSYRMGIEVDGNYDITRWLNIGANMALSKNKIKDFDEVVEDWDLGSRTIHYDNSTLAFSPSLVGNAFLRFHHAGFEAVWHTQGVSRQYLDNTENKDRSLPGFTTSSLSLGYTAKVSKALGIKQVVLGLDFNNIFNRHYAASGWVYSAISESLGHGNDNRYYQIGFIPMAGFTAMSSITLKF